jgi:prepilin signal peptidase PulO-like enzyme (type II secretory pathway)
MDIIAGLHDTLEIFVVGHSWLFVGWMVAVGAAIGSFLNVVVYRWPAGLSISHPPSRCPACKHPIRIRDNIPVLSWFLLRAKCRHCKSRISARYPIVEAIVALIFGILTWLVVRSLGSVTDESVSLRVARLAYYIVLPCCLVCLFLIDYDGNRAPRSLLLFAMIAASIPPLLLPDVRVLSDEIACGRDPARIMIDIVFGVAAGLLLGAVTAPVVQTLAFNTIWMTVVAGSYLGWKSVIVCSLLSVIASQIERLWRRNRIGCYGAFLASFAFVDIARRFTTHSDLSNLLTDGVRTPILLGVVALYALTVLVYVAYQAFYRS